ncbi:hypothetical protein OIO90_001964 [Microbotryomycetes sp. JL221]|nr:hypothetical protein OIO90_001964 [Microbotryomycetes sp. JL221]
MAALQQRQTSYLDDHDLSTKEPDVFSDIGTRPVLDEGAKILAAAADQSPPTEEEIRVVRRKADLIVMPLLCFTVGLQYADKSALAVAALFGIVTDLRLFDIANGRIDTHLYSMCVMIASVGFIAGTFPLAYIAQRFSTGKCAAAYIFLWGTILFLTPLCNTYSGLMGQRFALGFMEAGVSPIFLSVLSMWYNTREQALRATILFSANGLTIIPLLACSYGLIVLDDKVAAWKIQYLFLSSITVCWAVIFALFIPDSPVTARFLNERQKYVAVERLRANQAGITSKQFKWSQVWDSLKDPKTLLLAIMVFCMASPNGAIGSFTPLVIQNVIGASSRRTLLLLMPAAAVAGCSNLVAGTITYLFPNTRSACIIFMAIVTLIGAALEWKLDLTNKQGLLGALYPSNTAGASRKTVVGSIVFMSLNASAIAAPFFFFKNEAPRYASGFRITMALLAVGIGCTILYAVLCARENRLRDKLPKDSQPDHAFEDLTDLENKAFRYQL